MGRYVPAMILASCIGTISDVALVNKGFYSFPHRPFPTIFSVDIFFALFVLPVATFFFLFIGDRVSSIFRWLIILGIGFMAPWFEGESETWGLFVHSEKWNHFYSLAGYIVFLSIVWSFHQWASRLLFKK